ncbi:acyl-CoA dehydrogenase [Sphingorhabdus sp. M41]|nr:acyl-CoA dehydrogenase [Sphingorhabdus sp. M41]
MELSELRDAAQKAFPASQLKPPRDESWQLIAEMGWLMLDLPEDLGGLGLERDAVATIHHELGRVLPAAPLIPALLGLQGIAASSTLVDKTSWIERICGGEYIPLHMLPAAVQKQDDGTYHGRVAGVFEGDMASHILAEMGDVYTLIPLDAPGVTLHEQPLWDESRRLFDIEMTGYQIDPSLVIAEGPAVQRLHDSLSISTHLALSADSLGAAGALLDMTIEYLKTRRQFDRPLAMFQALKHRVADLKVKLVAGEALFWSRIAGDPTPLEMGALKAHSTSIFRDIAEESIQLHGGIGLTEEHPCHLFFKRAFLNCQLCGNEDHWDEEAGRRLLDAN